MGCEIVHVYKDHGISGAKGRDKRPAVDALCRDAAKRQFDMVMAWSVDRLGRSLQDLVGFLSELHALRIDLIPAPAGPTQPSAPMREAFLLTHRPGSNQQSVRSAYPLSSSSFAADRSRHHSSGGQYAPECSRQPILR